jgi:hypothetical protein
MSEYDLPGCTTVRNRRGGRAGAGDPRLTTTSAKG